MYFGSLLKGFKYLSYKYLFVEIGPLKGGAIEEFR